MTITSNDSHTTPFATEVASFADASIGRDRDQFTRELLRELAGILEESVGLAEAEGFISLVGSRLGIAMNDEYCQAAGTDRLNRAEVAGALVDRTSPCMTTSNVFGRIGAENFGYARVELEETIAAGDAGCRVVLSFDEGDGGREYYGA